MINEIEEERVPVGYMHELEDGVYTFPLGTHFRQNPDKTQMLQFYRSFSVDKHIYLASAAGQTFMFDKKPTILSSSYWGGDVSESICVIDLQGIADKAVGINILIDIKLDIGLILIVSKL